ncbi:hypothetical protein B0O80DRAFT_432992 [Mortierella sp. GBAus27b]|nr:hypothetical protein B0O80DRAFT_432992 [Mortierella sp. GBAus27b]
MKVLVGGSIWVSDLLGLAIEIQLGIVVVHSRLSTSEQLQRCGEAEDYEPLWMRPSPARVQVAEKNWAHRTGRLARAGYPHIGQ